MPYICTAHQCALRQSPRLAMTLWRNAMTSGMRALQTEHWDAARNFFGSAYETALITLSHTPRKIDCQFGTEHLVDAGKLLSTTLCKLKRWDEAQLCLLTLQNSLLQPQTSASAFISRDRVVLIEKFIDELIYATGIDARLQHSNTAGMNVTAGMEMKEISKHLH